MPKKRMLSSQESRDGAKAMLRQLKTNAEALSERSHGSSEVHDLCAQLANLADSLLEWGEASGKITVWGAFTPSMFNYDDIEEDYYATQD